MKHKFNYLAVLFLLFLPISCMAADIGAVAPVFQRPAQHIVYNDIAYGNGVYVAGGEGGLLRTSNDGQNWTLVSIPLWVNVRDIVWNGSAFVIPAYQYVLTSRDGYTWDMLSWKDTAALSAYGAIAADGVFSVTDPSTGRQVSTRQDAADWQNYTNTIAYQWNGRTLFFGRGRGIDAAKESYNLYQAAGGGAELLSEGFRNPLCMTYSSGQYRVYCFYVESPTYSGEDVTTVEVKTSSDLRSWTSETGSIPAAADTLLVSSMGGAVTVYGQTPVSTQLVEYTLNGAKAQETGRRLPGSRASRAVMLSNGTSAVLAGDRIFTARPGELFRTYQEPAAETAINARGVETDFYQVDWNGKEWHSANSSILSADLQQKTPIPATGEAAKWMQGKSLKLVWTGKEYLAMDRRFRPQPGQTSGEIYRISADWKQKPLAYTTPGYVDDISYVDGTCYLLIGIGSDPETGYEAHDLYYSNDLARWTRLDAAESVPLWNGKAPYAVLPTETYGAYRPNGEMVPEKTELSLIGRDAVRPNCRYEDITFQPVSVGVMEDYYYAITESGDAPNKTAALWLSPDGVYWLRTALPDGLHDIREVFVRGNQIVVQRGKSLNVLCVALDKEEIINRIEQRLTEQVYVKVNDTLLGFAEPPVIEEGRTLVPMRMLFEQLGAEVQWDAETATATAKKAGTTVSFRLDDRNAAVNGRTEGMEVPARLIGDKTMVPLRFLSEVLGYQVDWDEKSHTAWVRETAAAPNPAGTNEPTASPAPAETHEPTVPSNPAGTHGQMDPTASEAAPIPSASPAPAETSVPSTTPVPQR